jgi:hypothetical protein
MTDQPKTALSMWERSNIVRSFRWLFSWRGIRRVVIVLAWTVTIIGLWYGEENWRGRRAWNQHRQATEARGESLDLSAYIPKPVPDDQNFAQTPFLKATFLQPNIPVLTNDLYARAADHVTKTKSVEADKGRRHFTDLAAWQMASDALQSGALKRDQEFKTDKTGLAARAAAAPVVLDGLKADEAIFAELRAASSREFSRYPLKYDLENPWRILLPHLARIKQVCQRLNLEACADLASGQPGPALADVKLMLSLADSIKSEPFIISYLVRVACEQIAVQSVWEGLAEHAWTDPQLQEIQARFSSYDFLADAQQPLLGERVCGILTVDLAKKTSFLAIGDYQGRDTGWFEKMLFNRICPLIPSGWYDQERLNYCTLYDAQWKDVVNLAAKTVSPSTAEFNAHDVNRQIQGVSSGKPESGSGFKALLRHRLVVTMMEPSVHRFAAKIAIAQTGADQAALACALERYRLANGQFPETLEALAPRFISHAPNDVITGQPYKYRRDAGGQFILYSVGWNEKDDGGTPGKTLFDLAQGDWVWSYPAMEP